MRTKHARTRIGMALAVFILTTGSTLSWAGEEKPRQLAGHEGGTIYVAVAPDGRTVATAGHDGAVRLWDLRSGKETGSFRITGQAGMVVFTQDGKAILVGGPTAPPTEWALDGLRLGPVYYSNPYMFTALAVSPDGKWGAAGWERTIEVFERGSGKVVSRFAAHEGSVGNLAFSADGRLLASSGPGGKAALWDAATGASRGELPGHAPWAIAFGPGGYTVASTASAREVVLSETLTAAPRRRLTAPEGADISLVAVSPDGRLTVAGTQTGELHLWDVETGKYLRKLGQHGSIVESLAFSRDGRHLLAVARGEKAVSIWDVPAPAKPREVKLSKDELEAAWKGLEGGNAEKAFEAILALSGSPAQAVTFLRERPRQGAPGADRMARWIKELDHDRFAIRQEAEEGLARHVEQAAALLREALKEPPSPEARRRLERLLERLDRDEASPATRLEVRVIEVYERLGARQALRTLVRERGDTRVGQAAKDALSRLGK